MKGNTISWFEEYCTVSYIAQTMLSVERTCVVSVSGKGPWIFIFFAMESCGPYTFLQLSLFVIARCKADAIPALNIYSFSLS